MEEGPTEVEDDECGVDGARSLMADQGTSKRGAEVIDIAQSRASV